MNRHLFWTLFALALCTANVAVLVWLDGGVGTGVALGWTACAAYWNFGLWLEDRFS